MLWSKYLVTTLALAIALLMVGCGKKPDIPVIASGAEYSDILDEAEKLSRAPLERYEKGEELSKEDKDNLQEALRKFEGLVAFLPDQFGAYFGAAKIQMALGAPEKALVHFQGFIEYAPANPADQFKPALAEAHYSLGTIFEDLGQFDLVKANAEKAVEYSRANANYLSLLSSVKLRDKDGLIESMKKFKDPKELQALKNAAEDLEKEAHRLVDEALAIDPSNGRAKQLHSMMLPHE